jgi:methylated-DNA-protein-cysteine methyltransferase-like protein
MPEQELPLYHRIYAIVRQIPAGKVASYGQIASLVEGCSAQMIGFALAALKPGTDVPWQRVVNVRGQISSRPGFGGLLQREILEEEGVEFGLDSAIDLEKFGWLGF